MYLFRKTGNSNSYDPRDNKWAVYKCDNCNHEEYINVTYNFTFDYDSPRMCPQCKTISQQDYIEALKTKINKLTEEKSKINIQIETLISELEQKTKTFKEGEVYV